MKCLTTCIFKQIIKSDLLIRNFEYLQIKNGLIFICNIKAKHYFLQESVVHEVFITNSMPQSFNR